MGITNGWVDGIAREPAHNAGYRAGRNYGRVVGMHFTVGRCAGDRSIGQRGYFNFYVPRDPGCGPGATQFAEWNATCWHMCEWNVLGPGIEFERLNWEEKPTAYQIEKGGLIVAALIDAGVADTFYDGPRVAVGNPGQGFVNHASARILKCDQHTDGVTRAEWGAMRATGKSTKGSDMDVAACNIPGIGVWTGLVAGGYIVRQFPATPAGAYGLSQAGLDFAKARDWTVESLSVPELQAFDARTKAAAVIPGAGGASPAPPLDVVALAAALDAQGVGVSEAQVEAAVDKVLKARLVKAAG